jgi:hypothetical protein
LPDSIEEPLNVVHAVGTPAPLNLMTNAALLLVPGRSNVLTPGLDGVDIELSATVADELEYEPVAQTPPERGSMHKLLRVPMLSTHEASSPVGWNFIINPVALDTVWTTGPATPLLDMLNNVVLPLQDPPT